MSLVCIPTIYCRPGAVGKVVEVLPVQDCIDNQPNTHAYYFFTLHKSPDTIVGFELYSDKSGLQEHGNSDSFKAFGKAAGPCFEKPFSLAQAAPICGFLSKDVESASQINSDRESIAVMATITCKSPEHRTKFLDAAAEFVSQVENEQGTLSYYWSADMQDASKVYVFERYADMAAAGTHGQNAKAFMRSTKDLVKSTVIETGTPVGGFLKKTPSLIESNYTLAPALPSTTPTPDLVHQSTSTDVSFTRARNGIPQSIAHRGYKALFPENTLIALEGALKSGADGIETDVHLSRDGEVVIAHDASTERCYGKPGNVWDQDFYGPAGMSTFVTVDEPYSRMPTLRQVLDLIARREWSGKWLLLDVKVDNQVQVIQAISDTMSRINPDMSFWARRVVLGIWHHKYLPYCKQFLASLPITHIGLHTSYARRYFLHNPAISSFNLQLHALNSVSQQAFVKEAHDLGKPVYVWTVNDQESMRLCIYLKVDAILSDDPSKTKLVQNEDLSSWNPRTHYWTWTRLVRGYGYNIMLYFVMWHRIFWQFRDLKSQRYLRPQEKQ